MALDPFAQTQGVLMRSLAKMMLVGMLATGGSFGIMQGTAMAYPNCERFAAAPIFDGDRISGLARVSCSQNVPAATLTGRIKEDRSFQPDAVHDTESTSFTSTRGIIIQTTTCQDDDDIYTEAQINSENPAQSSRREMQC